MLWWNQISWFGCFLGVISVDDHLLSHPDSTSWSSTSRVTRTSESVSQSSWRYWLFTIIESVFLSIAVNHIWDFYIVKCWVSQQHNKGNKCSLGHTQHESKHTKSFCQCPCRTPATYTLDIYCTSLRPGRGILTCGSLWGFYFLFTLLKGFFSSFSLLLLRVKGRGCHTLLKPDETNCDLWIWAIQIKFDWLIETLWENRWYEQKGISVRPLLYHVYTMTILPCSTRCAALKGTRLISF